MVLLRELIARYLSWVQTGGQRASLAGIESLAREDTFEMEDEIWDFDINVRYIVHYITSTIAHILATHRVMLLWSNHSEMNRRDRLMRWLQSVQSALRKFQVSLVANS